VKSAPWLFLVNRFSILAIEESNTSTNEPTDIPPSFSDPNTKAPIQKPKWKRKLPKQLSASVLDACRVSLILLVEVLTTDTTEIYSIKALLDYRAMGSFINNNFV